MTPAGPARLLASIAAGAVLLAACSGSESGSTDTAGATVEAPAGDDVADGGEGSEAMGPDDAADTGGAAGDTATDAAATDTATIDAPATDTPTTDTATTDTAATDTAATDGVETTTGQPGDEGPAAPESTAAPTTAPEPVPGGRLLAVELDPASDDETNPLPDVIVEDVRRGAQVNLRNVFPAARPVLVWMWAPH